MNTYGWKNEETLRAAMWYRENCLEGVKRLSSDPQKLGEILKTMHLSAIMQTPTSSRHLYLVLVEFCINRIDWTQLARFLLEL